MQTPLRTIAGALAVLGLLGLAACGPAATTAPTAAPAKAGATAPSTNPAEATPSAPKPAATPAPKSEAPASKPVANANWKADWDKILASAKQEGKVVVDGPRGELYRQAAMAFRQAYPDIQLDFTGLQGGDFAAKLLPEREGGQFLWDVYVGGADTAITLKNKGILDPLKPALLLPEVVDDSKWLGGLDDGWLDLDRQYTYQFLGYLQYGARVNRDMAPESELISFDQLIDPKWKGKITVQDPRQAGAGQTYFAYLFIVKGEDWFRKLLAQDLVLITDPRLMLEGVIRGRYPIGMGVTQADLQVFEQQGLARSIKPLDPDNPAATKLTGGSGNLTLISKAPHPNAAKVFANWLLSSEGQKAFVEAISQGSRRLDVPLPAGDAPKPGVKYMNNQKEEYLAQNQQALQIVKEVLK